MSVGKAIKAARLRLDWSQEQLGRRLSVTKASISRWENDKQEPSLAQTKVLAETLGIMPHVLFAVMNGETTAPSAEPSPPSHSEVDPVFLAVWRKLTPKQRKKLTQIAVIIAEA